MAKVVGLRPKHIPTQLMMTIFIKKLKEQKCV